MKITKNTIYNLLFFVLIGLIIYPTSRIWFMRQIAFSPAVAAVDNREQLNDYSWKLKGLTTSDLDFATCKDKVVFINFWATWCPPCIAEMPMIQKLYDDYKDKVTFVMITTDTKSKVQSFYDKKGYKLPTFAMQRNIPEQFSRSNSIPASYLIAKDGSIVISKTGAANWNSEKVRTLLDALLKE